MKKNYKKNRGFTLTELLVVVAIIIILTAIILPNYRRSSDHLNLERAAYKLAQDIREVAEMSMSARELEDGTMPDGYSVLFRRPSGSEEWTSYKLYANTEGSENCDGLEIKTLDLEEREKRIVIKELSSGIRLCVSFEPPSPVVSFFGPGASGPDGPVAITIALKSDPSKTKTVIVNKAGLIYVE